MAQIAPIIRHYEVVTLLRPEITEQGQEAVRTRVRDIITAAGGQEMRWETWGKRKLAYEIAKQTKAVYLYLSYIAPQTVVMEVERNLKIMDNVLKFQTVKLSDSVDLEKFDIEAEKAKKSPLYLSPEDAAAAERTYQREHDWALGGRATDDDDDFDDDDVRGGRGVDDDEEDR